MAVHCTSIKNYEGKYHLKCPNLILHYFKRSFQTQKEHANSTEHMHLYKENANLVIGVQMTNVHANLTEHVQTLYKLSMQY